MRHRPARHTRGFVTRVAVASAASLAVVASSATGAMAEGADAAPTNDLVPSGHLASSVETEDLSDAGTPASTDPEAPTEVPAELTDETPADEAEAAPEAEQAPDDGPGTDLEGGGDVEDEDVDAVEPPVVAPLYGSQKIRIGVQQADGSYLPEGTSFGGTTMSITLTGGTTPDGDPLPDASTTCTVPEQSTVCVPADFVTNGTNLDLEPGQTAVITPTSVPAGLVIAPASQTVLPKLCPTVDVSGQQICFPSETENLDFDVSAVPATISAATTEGQPVVVDVVAPLDVGPDNGVTGVTVTAQSANGTAVVTGDLPPVATQPVDPDDMRAPVAAAAPSGTSRIVFTPNAGFVGTTTFGYAVATQNGTLTGVATVTVAPAPVVAPPTAPVAPSGAGNVGSASPPRVTPARADGTLPSTGGPAEELLALGALLVVAGAGAMAARRRSDRGLVG